MIAINFFQVILVAASILLVIQVQETIISEVQIDEILQNQCFEFKGENTIDKDLATTAQRTALEYGDKWAVELECFCYDYYQRAGFPYMDLENNEEQNRIYEEMKSISFEIRDGEFEYFCYNYDQVKRSVFTTYSSLINPAAIVAISTMSKIIIKIVTPFEGRHNYSE